MNCGDIYLVDLDDSKGHEQRGRRPALILGEANGMEIVAPLTSNTNTACFSHTHVLDATKENGLDMTSVVLVFQLVSLDRQRFVHRVGTLSDFDLVAVDALLKDLLKL